MRKDADYADYTIHFCLLIRRYIMSAVSEAGNCACCQHHQRDWVVKFSKDCDEETDDVVVEVNFDIRCGCP